MADAPFHTVREQARAELLWYLRHKAALERWPVVAEDWAGRLEARRRAEVDPPDRDITYFHGGGR
jgi:hypothetical protein